MTILDLIIIVVILAGYILGFKDGFVRKIVGFVGFVLSIILATLFYERFGKLIESVTGMEIYLSKIVAAVIIFIGVMIIFSVLKRLIHPFDKVNNFLNQVLGGVIGAVQILFFLSAAFFLLNVFEIPSNKAARSSLLYDKVYKILPAAIDYLNKFTPKTREMFKDYLNEKNSSK